MITTKTLRLSGHHLNIADQISDQFGMSFTDVIRHLLDQYHQEQVENHSIQKTLHNIQRQIESLDKTGAENTDNLSDNSAWDMVVADLQAIKRDLSMVKQILLIIGQADPRTKSMIGSLE